MTLPPARLSVGLITSKRLNFWPDRFKNAGIDNQCNTWGTKGKQKMKRDVRQPVMTDIKMTEDLYVKHYRVPDAGTIMPQHSHTFDHVTLLAYGSMRVVAGDVMLGDYHAPAGIVIRARVKHTMTTLTDGVVFACIHALDNTEDIEIEELHELERG
jgi:hypothetical protein